MALFRITVRQNKYSNGIRLEKGMTVDVSSRYSNPVTTNGGHEILTHFKECMELTLKRMADFQLFTSM